ncbi:MAG: DUF2470 domain-containing protein [Gammaproteobacteria bacterium]|nr:DUF2470 domain-containing protein [Gammaproteobacteria bacterium]
MQKTALIDLNQKLDIIEHINQDHTDELLSIAHVFTCNTNTKSAELLDLFEEGAEVLLFADEPLNGNKIFIPFQIQGDIEEKIIYEIYAATAKQGKVFSDTKRQFFEVIDSQALTQITCKPSEQGSQIIDAIYSLPSFETMWGACEKNAGKQVRAHARNTLDIAGSNNHVRGYWSL